MDYDTLDTSRTQRTLTGIGAAAAGAASGRTAVHRAVPDRARSASPWSSARRAAACDVLEAQVMRFALAVVAMIMLAQIPPRLIRAATPWVYLLGLMLLLDRHVHRRHRDGRATLARSGRRALSAVRDHEAGRAAGVRLVSARAAAAAEPGVAARRSALAILVPTLLIAEQPDLGTALLVAAGGGMVVLLAGLQLRYIARRDRPADPGRRTSPGNSCCTTISASAC